MMTWELGNTMIRKDRVASAVRVLAGAVGVLLALSSVVLSAQAASAAPIVTYPNAVSNISITHEDGSDGPLNQWDAVRITADWSVPDGATAGQTFGMTLPPEFSNYGAGDFEITDPETGEVMATCVIASGSAPEVVCTLAESVSGREQVGGSFWISVTATESTTEESVEFEVGDTIEIVDLPGEGGIIPEDLTASTSPYKYSSTTDVEGRIVWTVEFRGLRSRTVHSKFMTGLTRASRTSTTPGRSGSPSGLSKTGSSSARGRQWTPRTTRQSSTRT